MPEPVITSNSSSISNTNHHNESNSNQIHIHQDSSDKLANSQSISLSSTRSSSPSSNSSSQDQDLTQEDLTSSRHPTETTNGTSNHSTPSLLNDNQSLGEDAEEEDLDPSGPFEGPEKLLEIWFAPGQHSLPKDCLVDEFSILEKRSSSGKGIKRNGLRAVPRAEWEKALDLVKCKVLSTLEGAEVDAYLLR